MELARQGSGGPALERRPFLPRRSSRGAGGGVRAPGHGSQRERRSHRVGAIVAPTGDRAQVIRPYSTSVIGSRTTLSVSRSTTSREALPSPWRRKLAAPAAAPTTTAPLEAIALRPGGGECAHHRVAAPLAKACASDAGGVSHHARSSASTSAGCSPRVTITARRSVLAQSPRGGAQLCRLGYRAAHELGQLPVIDFHQVRFAAQRAVPDVGWRDQPACGIRLRGRRRSGRRRSPAAARPLASGW